MSVRRVRALTLPARRGRWDDGDVMSHAPVVPALRAAVFTAVCVGLGAGAHQAMSQAPIPPWALVLGSIGVYASAQFGACRGERNLTGITLLMGVLQVALHLLFDYAQHVRVAHASAVSAVSTITGSMPGMAMHGGSMPMPMPTPSPIQSPDGAMQMSAGMLIAHALAALACAWWLRRGEAAIHAVARMAAKWLVTRLVLRVFRTPAPVRRAEAPLPESTALPTATRWLRSSRVLRGPPRIPSST